MKTKFQKIIIATIFLGLVFSFQGFSFQNFSVKNIELIKQVEAKTKSSKLLKYLKSSFSLKDSRKKLSSHRLTFSKSGCNNFNLDGKHYGGSQRCKVLGINCGSSKKSSSHSSSRPPSPPRPYNNSQNKKTPSTNTANSNFYNNQNNQNNNEDLNNNSNDAGVAFEWGPITGLNITCSPVIVDRGKDLTINWVSDGAETCSVKLNGSIVPGITDISGQYILKNVQSNTIQVDLNCSNPDGYSAFKNKSCLVNFNVIED